MKKKMAFIALLSFIFLPGCDYTGDYAGPKDNVAITVSIPKDAEPTGYDVNKGEGKFKLVTVASNLNSSLATAGEKVYNEKCMSCHKLTNEKLVGPGWADVTKRHEPSWIMNFITNTNEMLDKDPAAIAQLKQCMVRMPNQNLTDDEVRNILEFMRRNDGIK